MSQTNLVDNRRIARNTALLYVRMIVVTLLSLVTVRYTLALLGDSDFGIYNVVAGVVTFMSFVTATISSATQRFLAFELGRDGGRGYNDMFNMLLALFGIVAVIICLLLEAFSYPIIYHWLNLPADRLDVAFTVYHLAVLSFFSVIVSMPFLSSILANERMGVYAYIAIFDTVAKLAILALLLTDCGDRLIVYAVAMTVVSVLTNLIYVVYNQRCVAATRIYWHWSRDVVRRLSAYVGWSFFGAVSGILCMQGLTILINLFFGVVANTAKAIADRVMLMVQSFVMNFYMAVSPQITKSYAAADHAAALRLAYTSTRLGYYLMLLLIAPFIVLADLILTLWLGDDCSADTVLFTQLSLLFVLVNVFETPVTFLIRATGDIRRYQVCVGCVTLMVVPVSALLYWLGCAAFTSFVVLNAVYLVAQVVRIVVLRRFFQTGIADYFRQCVRKPMAITLVVAAASVSLLLLGVHELAVAVAVECLLMVVLWTYGLADSERDLVRGYIMKRIKR
ncbi:MAG: oligosaccharide flippase family protein [Bacteroidaceae bacterium]|nr:oligosaccharide flippase family protein [Bacteroidaceae bacterium]